MTERHELEALFVQHLPIAEKILGALARRRALTRDAADEFAAWAKLRLIENDYAILAKFRGESSLPTYLTVVLATLYQEYRVAEMGRWRPSAAARRAGGVVIKLETLVYRDGRTVAHAGEVLRTSGLTSLSDRELADILATLPRRSPLRPITLGEPVIEPAAESQADEILEREESAVETEAARRALHAALETLPRDDRLIVRLHYMKDMSLADIGRALALPQKPLYRRL